MEWQGRVFDSTFVIDTTLPGVKLVSGCQRECCTPTALATALQKGVRYVHLHYDPSRAAEPFRAALKEVDTFVSTHSTEFVIVRITSASQHAIPAFHFARAALRNTIYNDGYGMLNLWTARLGEVRGSIAVFVDGLMGFDTHIAFHTLDQTSTWSPRALARLLEQELKDSEKPLRVGNLWLTLPAPPLPATTRPLAPLWGCLPSWLRPKRPCELPPQVLRAVDPARLAPYLNSPPIDMQVALFAHADTPAQYIDHVLLRNFPRERQRKISGV